MAKKRKPRLFLPRARLGLPWSRRPPCEPCCLRQSVLLRQPAVLKVCQTGLSRTGFRNWIPALQAPKSLAVASFIIDEAVR